MWGHFTDWRKKLYVTKCNILRVFTARSRTVYGVDPQSGRLMLTGSIAVPEALCVRFVQVQE